MQGGPDKMSAVDTKIHFEEFYGVQHSLRIEKQECILIRVDTNLI